MQYTLSIKSPVHCTEQEIRTFTEFMLHSNRVMRSGLDGRIKAAKALAFYKHEDNVIGVGALKMVDRERVDRVFSMAGVRPPGRSMLEYGWVYIDENHRGNKLFKVMTQQMLGLIGRSLPSQPVFATANASSTQIATVNRQVGLNPVGCPYESARAECLELQLFVKGV